MSCGHFGNPLTKSVSMDLMDRGGFLLGKNGWIKGEI